MRKKKLIFIGVAVVVVFGFFYPKQSLYSPAVNLYERECKCAGFPRQTDIQYGSRLTKRQCYGMTYSCQLYGLHMNGDGGWDRVPIEHYGDI